MQELRAVLSDTEQRLGKEYKEIEARIEAAYRTELRRLQDEAAQEGGGGVVEKLNRLSARVGLTEQEQQLLACLCDTELNTEEIADRFYVSRSTAQRMMAGVYRKTGAMNRMGLLRLLAEM